MKMKKKKIKLWIKQLNIVDYIKWVNFLNHYELIDRDINESSGSIIELLNYKKDITIILDKNMGNIIDFKEKCEELDNN